MEYLVTMTTHVPDGTTDSALQLMRDREAAHSRKLAEQGSLLRLWRPPLQPGEWRSLGLFAAASSNGLQQTLASMPLHVWRSDEVTPLSPHPDDPRAASSIGGTEFLTSFTIAIPHGTSPEAVTDAEAAESARMKALGQGPLERLWMLSSPSGWLGLWKASSPAELQAILTSLPMDSWMTVQTTPLSRHPSDPGTDGSGP